MFCFFRPTAFTPLETARRTVSGRLIQIAIIAGALFFIVIVTVVLAVVIPRQIAYLEYYEVNHDVHAYFD